MEILQMVQSSKRFTTFFRIIFVAFPVVLIVNFMYQNSTFALFENLTKGKVALAENATNQNATSVKINGLPLGAIVHNKSDENTKGTLSKVWGKFQNDTKTEGGGATKAKNNTGLKNDSTSNDKDNLFDGLLASGYDEVSCISRKQSHLYRKSSSPHKPSAYLISKLRNYEGIHRRCGPHSKAYNRDMTKILRSKNNASAMCNYLIWTPANGLGNQMISMAATFLYALLTNRVLLVKFGKDKQGLFCEPFLNSTWLLSEKSPFWNEKHVQTYQSMIEKHIIGNTTSKEYFSLPSIVFLNLQYNPSFPEKFFHCDHSQDILSKVPLLILQSDQYFVPSLFMTPIFNKELNKMFPETDTVFHHLGRYLFQPSNEAWGVINNFYNAHLAKADERIGLQIRVFNPLSTSQQTIMNLVLNCTIQNKLLPQVGVQSQISKSPPSGKNKTTTKVVLVTSLYPEYGENLRIMYMNKPTISGEAIEVYQPSGEEKQKFNDNKHNMKAWTEMYLLSLCDVLVTTSLSTFGYVAQGLGNLRPWLLYKLVSNDTHFPACERDFSMEPCYHAPPKHDCSGKPIKDLVSSFLDLRRCKDFWFGVKLFDGSM